MTTRGAQELYMWLMATWPGTIRPGASEDFVAAKVKQLLKIYEKYTDQEVMEACQRWAENNEKYPAPKNIINEIQWSKRVQTKGENEELWPMDFITKEGIEWSYGLFKRSVFVNHPKNPEHLEPEEWERRFVLTRRRIMDKIWKQLKEEERKNATKRR